MNMFGDVSLASSNSPSQEFLGLVKSIGECRSKQEEDNLMLREMDVLRGRFSDASVVNTPNKLRECLVRAMYVEMLGHRAEFSHIHAVKMTSDKTSLLTKRLGYLACNLFLHSESSFMLLLVNTIQLDLNSKNSWEVCCALLCLSRLMNAELVPILKPTLLGLLKHENVNVRKKTVIALFKMIQMQPSLTEEMRPVLQQSFCDPDPAVMGATLHVITDLARRNPSQWKALVPSLVGVLRQVIDLKLPRDFEYHRVPAPWIQIRIVSLLSILCANDRQNSELVYDVLQETLRRADSGTNIGYAIVYEVVRCLTSIFPSPALLEIATVAISRFVQAPNNNLRYAGVTALSQVVKISPQHAMPHQLSVVECLEDNDLTLKRKTLELLFRMASSANVQVVADKLLETLRSPAAVDPHWRRDLSSKLLSLAERFSPDSEWYLNIVMETLEAAGDYVDEEKVFKLAQLIAEGPHGVDHLDAAFRQVAADTAYTVLTEGGDQLPDLLVQISVWILGEYSEELVQLGVVSDVHVVLKLLLERTSFREFKNANTAAWVVSAAAKIACRHPALLSECARQAKLVLSRADCVELAQKVAELQVLAKKPMLAKSAFPYDGACEDIVIDEKASFLNDFVQRELSMGKRKYDPRWIEQQAMQHSSHAPHDHAAAQNPHSLLAGINFTPYQSAPMNNSQNELFEQQSTPSSANPTTAGNTSLKVDGPRRWGPKGLAPVPAAPTTTTPAPVAAPVSAHMSPNPITSVSGGVGLSANASVNISTHSLQRVQGGFSSAQPQPQAVAPVNPEKMLMAQALFGGQSQQSQSQSQSQQPTSRIAAAIANRRNQQLNNSATTAAAPPQSTPTQPQNSLLDF